MGVSLARQERRAARGLEDTDELGAGTETHDQRHGDQAEEHDRDGDQARAAERAREPMVIQTGVPLQGLRRWFRVGRNICHCTSLTGEPPPRLRDASVTFQWRAVLERV